MAERERMKQIQGDRWEERGYIFTQDDGKRLHPDSITDWLGRFSKEKNLPHIHPHAFRHTAASMMIAGGVDLVTTATIYAHKKAVAKAKAANVRAGVFTGKSGKTSKKTV